MNPMQSPNTGVGKELCRSEEEWNAGLPKDGQRVRVLIHDCFGSYEMIATKTPYKRPKAGECKKGFRKGWRWVNDAGERLTRKENPSGWLPL